MKEKDKSAFLREKAKWAAILGAVMLVGVTIGYIGKFDKIYEMTFLSNFVSGAILLIAALHIKITGRDIKHFLYFDAAMLLMVVLGICISFAPLATFGFPSVIVHFVDPVLMLVFYLTFCDAREVKYSTVASALCFPLAYYLFMIAFGRVTGDSVYPYFDPNRFGAGMLVVWGAVAAAAIVAAGLIVMRIDRRVFVKREIKSAAGETDALQSSELVAPAPAPVAVPPASPSVASAPAPVITRNDETTE